MLFFVAASNGSTPTSAPSIVAASATVRQIGPVTSWLWAIGITPDRLVKPRVGLIPTTPQVVAGDTMEPSVSVPMAPATKLAATAAADPVLDPEPLWSSTYGIRHCPARPLHPLEDWNERKFAHSARLALPRITAPAVRSRFAIPASLGTFDPNRASDPAVVSILSAVATLSFTRIGIPWSGPRTWPALRSPSRRTAIASAAGVSPMTEFTVGPEKSIRSIRFMYARVSRRDVVLPECIAARSS